MSALFYAQLAGTASCCAVATKVGAFEASQQRILLFINEHENKTQYSTSGQSNLT